MLWEGGAFFETPPPEFTKQGTFKPYPPTGARTLDSRTAFYYGYTLDSPGMIMRIPDVGSQYLIGFVDSDRQSLRWRQDVQGHAAQGDPRGEILVADLVRQPVAFHAADASAVPPRRQPDLSHARGRSRSRRLDDDFHRPGAAAMGCHAATGFKPTPRRAGSSSCVCTARWKHSSPKSGGRAKLSW